MYHKTILVIEDDRDDRFLIERAFHENGVQTPIHFVAGVVEAMAYLGGNDRYADRAKFAYPTFIITDLNMPGPDGFAMLRELKSNAQWATIPMVIFTSSKDPRDIEQAYRLGASFYHAKPGDYAALRELLRILHNYWMTCKVPDLAPVPGP